MTFLFTDIEGSTSLLRKTRDRYAGLLRTHNELMRQACAPRGGHEMGTEGDAFFFAFARSRDAVDAAVAAQRALSGHRWPPGDEIRVRMGIHTGEPDVLDEGYLGLVLHRVARLSDAGHGGQILVSRATAEVVQDELPHSISLRDLGAHRLKDFERPQRIFQVVAEGLRCEFPPLRGLDAQPERSATGALDEQVLGPRTPQPPAGGRPLHRRPVVIAMFAGVLAAAVSIPVFALARDSTDRDAVNTPPPARTAKVSAVRVEHLTYREYRGRLGAGAGGIRGDVLSCPGALLTYHVALEGYRGAALPLVWQLFDAASGARLAESRARSLHPTAGRVEQDDQQFVPLPERAGRFRLIVQILAQDGRAPIAQLPTAELDARATHPPAGVARPPLRCLRLLAAR